MEKAWLEPKDILLSEHRSKLSKLNGHVSRVCSALIRLGSYDYKVKISLSGENEQVARIDNLPNDCPYHHIDIYNDGYIGYYSITGSCLFEGRTSKIKIIQKDILQIE